MGPLGPRFCLGRPHSVRMPLCGLKQLATVPVTSSPAIHLTRQRGVTPNVILQVIPKTAIWRDPTHTHLKHHRARAFHACSQALRVRYGYSYRKEKEGSEKLRNLPKSQSMRVLGLELWKQVAGSLSSPSASVVFKLCFTELLPVLRAVKIYDSDS